MIRKTVAAVLLLVGLIAPAAAGPAVYAAAPVVSSVPVAYDDCKQPGAPIVCKPGPRGSVSVSPAPEDDPSTTPWIPFNRWSEVTSKVHMKDPINDVWGAVQQGSAKLWAEFGLGSLSAVWSATVSLADFAANLKPVQALGAHLDAATASISRALLAQPFVFVAVAVVLVGTALWRKSRGREAGTVWRRLLGTTVTVGLIAMLGAGAAASRGEGAGYVPGVGSPGWLITKVQSFVGAGMNAAVDGLAGVRFDAPSTAAGGSSGGDAYRDQVLQERSKITSQGGAPLAAVSGLWEQAALRTWVGTQFGTANPYADRVWCHIAEVQAGVDPAMHAKLTAASMKDAPTPFLGSVLWRPDSNLELTKVGVWWAACDWDGRQWQVTPGFASQKDGSPWILPDSCEAVWNGTGELDGHPTGDGKNDGFNIGTGELGVARVGAYTTADEVKDFVNTWHQGNGFATLGLVSFSMLSAAAVFLILGLGLAGLIVVAKLISVVAVLALVMLLLIGLFRRDGVGTQLAGLAKHVVGSTVIAALASVLFVMVTWMTTVVAQLGSKALDPGSPISVLWVGLAPVGAMIAIHLLFKRVLKAPSPVSLSGALAWSKTLGAPGAAFTERLAGRAEGAAASAGRRVQDHALGAPAAHKPSAAADAAPPSAPKPSRPGQGGPPRGKTPAPAAKVPASTAPNGPSVAEQPTVKRPPVPAAEPQPTAAPAAALKPADRSPAAKLAAARQPGKAARKPVELRAAQGSQPREAVPATNRTQRLIDQARAAAKANTAAVGRALRSPELRRHYAAGLGASLATAGIAAPVYAVGAVRRTVRQVRSPESKDVARKARDAAFNEYQAARAKRTAPQARPAAALTAGASTAAGRAGVPAAPVQQPAPKTTTPPPVPPTRKQ